MKEAINHKIDVIKSALNTVLIAFFAVCGYIYINFATLGIFKFLVALLGAVLLAVAWSALLYLFDKFLKELKNANS